VSTFKEHKTNADRSAADRSRHKTKIREAIREGVHDIVSDESIIGQDGKKKIKIPVRGIKEYRFVYGNNSSNKKVGSAQGQSVRRGQKISQNGQQKPQQGSGKPGNEKGEDFYEVEITLEELSSYLFDSLDLPDLDKKKMKVIVGEKLKRSGYRKKGIRPRLSKKETIKNKIKRKKSAIRNNAYKPEDGERFPFHETDLKYKFHKKTPKENNNAVIFFMMDTSGSMTKEKKFMARSFFFLLYHFLNYKYTNVEVIFIAHDAEAREVNEDDFFKKAASGGTIISSALDLCLGIVDKRYHPDSWNIYAFHCTDGDNWPSDNEKAFNLSEKIRDLSQLYCYIEIIPGEQQSTWSFGSSTISKTYEALESSKFKIVNIFTHHDIWPSFRRIFGGKLNE
jgi:sporulation protein YhbH